MHNNNIGSGIPFFLRSLLPVPTTLRLCVVYCFIFFNFLPLATATGIIAQYTGGLPHILRQSADADKSAQFSHWLPRHVQSEGGLFLLDRRALSEGEVLLFRTKKSRHRAIAVMSVASSSRPQYNSNRQKNALASRFSDALTFKDWLRRVYGGHDDKALKVSVRTTEVVRPVLQHLYATRTHFQAPIIVHANTFGGIGSQQEKPVDVVHFVESARQLLPDAVISLGWTASQQDWTAVNRLHWAQAFQLLQLLQGTRQQPIMLNMRLNDAVHSAEVLEWLLGIQQPAIYLVLRGDVGDFVDSDSPLKRLVRLGAGQRLLFDVDENWRTRIRRFAPEAVQAMREQQPTGLLDRARWHNVEFASSVQPPLSTSVLSSAGAAFLGWPNSLLISSLRPAQFPAKRRLDGRVMFLPKRQSREIIPQRRSGMMVYLFDQQEPESLSSPRVPNSIQMFIGYDGRISLENQQLPFRRHRVPHHHHQKQQQQKTSSASRSGAGEELRRRKLASRAIIGSSSNSASSSSSAALYPKSSSAQLPKWPCYAFWLLDKGWRVEMEVWTEKCTPEEDDNEAEEAGLSSRDKLGENAVDDGNWVSQRVFLQLDTPISRSRRTRSVAVGKAGDGAIDFLVRGLEHNGGASRFSSSSPAWWLLLLPLLLLPLSLLPTIVPPFSSSSQF